MNRLYNSRGDHIANEVNGELHDPAGKNIGHFLTRESIFVDVRGRYLGEVVMDNRLMRKRNSPYTAVNFGSRGNPGGRSYGKSSNRARSRQPAGYEDIPDELLV